ncbi:MAG TPA: response regulator transcription factor [Cyclobacteriaceae bacterium]|jgi:DNA-binding NarL/FixJ family response regulator|nr:response regulator transcription factor [Cyclobacteriaceae bacterium]
MQDPRILLVDDHALFRTGIATLLQTSDRKFNVSEAINGQEAIEFCKERKVDLMVLDINMPVMNGFKVISYFRARKEAIRIIVLTIYNEPALVYDLLKQGVQGYLPKSIDPSELLNAIDTVLDGGIYYPTEFNNAIKKLIYERRAPIIDLSDKEVEIIELLAQGLTSKEIASKMDYTERTVETKKLRLERKLLAKNSTEIVSTAMRMGLIKL